MAERRATIGMLLTTLVELHQVQWLGAVDAARRRDVNLVTFVGRELESPLGFERHANTVYDLVDPDQLDGLIVWTTALQLFAGAGAAERLCRRLSGVPIVSVEEPLGDHPALMIDNRAGMREAVRHLVEEHGHRRIAFVRGPQAHPGAVERYRGYVDALAEHRLVLDPTLVSPLPGSWRPDGTAAWIRDLVAREPTVDAVVAVNDSFASVVVSTLTACGLHVPGDVAVVGFDDVAGIFETVQPIDGSTHPGREDRATEGDRLSRAVNASAIALPLTTVRAPFYGLGQRALELLVARIRGEPVPEPEPLPAGLIVRRSCGCFPTVRSDEQPDRRVADDDFAGLVTSYGDALAGGSEEPFLRRVENLVRHVVGGREARGGTVCFEALDPVRRAFPPASLEEAARAGVLWHRVELLVTEALERFAAYERVVTTKRDQLIRGLGQRLGAAHADFGGVLADGLPPVGVPSCQLVAYRDGDTSGGCQPLLRYEDGRRCDATAGTDACLEVRPRRRERSWSLVVLPLHFREEQLGVVALEVGPRNGWAYETLQEQLSSALHRRAVESALHAARDELEERVEARTSELAEANAALTEQIRQREQAAQERAQLEAQLRQAQKMEALGRLAGGIAHDFNNMLLVINGLAELLLQRTPGDADRHDLEQIQQAGQRAADLTQRLLTFSRRQAVQPRVVDLNGIVRQLEPMLRRLIRENVQLETRLASALPPVLADEGQLVQVVMNLAVNACEAMPRGGTLTIETAAEHDAERPRARLRVGDSGLGMDAEVQAHLFEPFFTTKSGAGGTGLGLATVFGIVQQSGGEIGVTSTPGRGTTFEVALPAAPAAPAEDGPAKTEPRPLGGSETILLVEDDTSVRATSRRFLEQYGYRVLEARDGPDALATCDRHSGAIDLLVTDVVMPGMTGAELVERTRRRLPGLPALFISGYVDSTLLPKPLYDQRVSLLQKPFSADELARKVGEALTQRRP